MSLRLFILLLALLSPAIAQEKPPSKSAAGNLQVRLLAEVVPENLGKVFLLLGETKSAEFELPANFLSDPVAVSSRAMVLKTINKEVSLCTIALPEQGNSFAVILVTAKPAGYKAIVVRTDDPTFKAGDVFFINRSEKTVLGKLGTSPLILKPGETEKSRPTGAIDNTYYDIAFATREESGDKLLSSSRWPIDNQLRSYLFFFTNAQGKTTFRAVDEYLIPAAPAKP
ncbi:MAG: hypothetical protein ABIS50_25960 [Luteolibacter sp.]|uniref:hypothetical protein n=1 Tax=Luteolibacter sp. TaxID=1962973 RepID=UPI003263CA51